MKFNKRHEKQLRDFMAIMDENGCLTTDQWTSGSGRFISSKALPPFVYKLERKEYAETERPQHGTVERTAYNFFQFNQKRRTVLVFDNKAFLDFCFDNIHGKEF